MILDDHWADIGLLLKRVAIGSGGYMNIFSYMFIYVQFTFMKQVLRMSCFLRGYRRSYGDRRDANRRPEENEHWQQDGLGDVINVIHGKGKGWERFRTSTNRIFV